jgi:hypothetical protein
MESLGACARAEADARIRSAKLDNIFIGVNFVVFTDAKLLPLKIPCHTQKCTYAYEVGFIGNGSRHRAGSRI